MTNLRGVYCRGVDTWLKTAPSFSRAKILQMQVSESRPPIQYTLGKIRSTSECLFSSYLEYCMPNLYACFFIINYYNLVVYDKCL